MINRAQSAIIFVVVKIDCATNYSDKDYAIEDVRIGNTKESMDMIGDFNLLIADVSAAFGRHIKYHVRSETLSTATQQPTPSFVYILVVDFNVTVNENFNEIHSNT